MRRRFFYLSAAFFAFSLASIANAAPKHKIALRLEYERPDPPDQCPDAEQLGLMIAAEFGYVVVRTDVSALLKVTVRRAGNGFRAELRAPHPSRPGEEWQRVTDKQGTCQELAYDIATMVKLGLGPLKWEGEEPPAVLAAPPEIEVGTVEIRPLVPRPSEPLALLLPRQPAALAPTTPTQAEEPPVQMEAAIGAVVSPYGLPSVAIGGNALLGLRWKRFALAMDIRGVITPASGIGEPPAPGRTSLLNIALLPCAVAPYVDVCGVIAGSRLAVELDAPSFVRSADTFSAGFGVRLAPRWQINERFTLLGYGEFTGELRSLVLQVSNEDGTPERNPRWRSPLVRVTLGLAFSVSIFK